MDMLAGEEITIKTGYGEKSVTFKNQRGEESDIFDIWTFSQRIYSLPLATIPIVTTLRQVRTISM